MNGGKAIKLPQWTPAQQAVLKHKGHALVVGAPGSGKTLLLLALAAQAHKAKKRVGLTTFSFRGHEYVHALAQGTYPGLWEAIDANTVRRHAAQQLAAAKEPLTFATNNQAREVLRMVMAQQAFTGTLEDAETVVRRAKGRAKKLPDNDKFFPFVQAYQAQMETLGLSDRHDIIRRHVLGMRGGTAEPLPVDLLLIDSLQDATELQLIWLQLHMAAGITVAMAADDDQTAYGLEGALGPDAVQQAEGWADVTRFTLEDSFRTPKALAPAIGKVARQLRHRVGKGYNGLSAAPATIIDQTFPNAPAEHAYLAETCAEWVAKGKTVGLITRTHVAAALLTHALRRHGAGLGPQGRFNPASFARLIWEEPAAQLVMALLYLMLGKANDAHLRLVLLGFEVPPAAVEQLFAAGLAAEGWLQRGCPLPALDGASPTTTANLQQLRRALRSATQVMQAHTLSAREVFKALIAQLLPHMPQADHQLALLATDSLLNLSGKLVDVLPRIREETLPDMDSPVTVAPVREVRNRTFDVVVLPYADASHWPLPPSELLGPNADHERRLFYLAITRTAGPLVFTHHHGKPTPFLAELHQSLKSAK